jgi:adenylyl-sulfate kinase
MTGFCVFFTGLPSSGKSTLAERLCNYLNDIGTKHDHLDGDELRKYFSRGLGFTKEDRIENCKRVSLLASKIVKHNGAAIVSLVSPYREMRDTARSLVEKEGGTFIEVFVDAPLELCIKRDVKGLYKKAINKEIENFTGISDPYEEPINPEIHLKTEIQSVEDCLDTIKLELSRLGLLHINEKPRALFIGRWQPFHKGHDYIIRKKLDENIPVLIAVRDTPIDEKKSSFFGNT